MTSGDGPLAPDDRLAATAPYDSASGDGDGDGDGRGDGATPTGSLGRFQLTGVLGRGGMGVVLAARDPALGRAVAIKLLRPDLWSGDDREGRARFGREAQAMAQLNHPNVVTVYEVGEVEGRPFIAMELVQGQTLRAWQDAAPRPWRELVAVYLDAGRGLAAAHDAGLVHRDFKPENVLLGADRRPRVSDFGLVSATAGAVTAEDVAGLEASGELTLRGHALGTPAYMACEQWTGGAVDARIDQFAFCVALWEALYRERPFAGTTAAELRAAVTSGRRRPPARGAAVPRRIGEALARGLASAPDQRWPSMAALLDRLARDAARPRAPLLAALGASAVAAGAVAVLLAGQGGDADACPAPVARAVAAWGPGGKDALLAHVRAIDPAGAGSRVGAIERVADGALEAWQALEVGACRAAAGARDAVAAQRTACLEARLAELTGTLALLRAATDPVGLDRALPALTELEPVTGCADARVLASFTAPPAAAARPLATALDDDVRALDLERVAGRTRDLHERGAALLDRARDLDHAPTTARALRAVARIALDRNDAATAAALLRELVNVAARAPDDRAAAWAWTMLLRLTAFDLGKPDDALAMIPAAQAAVLRAGDDLPLRTLLLEMEAEVHVAAKRAPEAIPRLEEARRLLEEAGAGAPSSPLRYRLGEVLAATGTTRLRTRELDQADAALRAALAALTEALGVDHPQLAFSYLNLGFVLHQQGRLQEALAADGEAVRIRRARLGRSPGLAWALNQHGNVLRELGRFAEAAAEAEEAYAMAKEVMRPDDPNLISIVLGTAVAAEALDQIDRALALYADAVAIGERTGARNVNVPIALLNRGELGRKAGRCAEALPDYQRSSELFLAYRGPDDFYNAYPLRGLGNCLLVLGRPAEAIAPLERASRLEPPGFGRAQAVAVRYLLGHARLASGRDRAGGRALIAQARRDAAALSAGTLAELATLLPGPRPSR